MKENATTHTFSFDERAIERLHSIKSKLRIEGLTGLSIGTMFDILALSEDAERIIRKHVKKHGKSKTVKTLHRETLEQITATPPDAE